MAELPQEAVESYREAGRGASVFEDGTDPDHIDLISDAAVNDIAPAMRAQERRRIKDALVGKDAMLAWGTGGSLLVSRETLERAFDDLETSDA